MRHLRLLAFVATISLLPTAHAADPTFDGTSMDGWMQANGQPVGPGWEIVDGAIHLDRKNGKAGNILTRREYKNFRLSFEWAIAEGGNSGLKYRVKKFDGRVLGCEYQIFDDAKRKLGPKHTSASLYAVYEPVPAALTLLKPAGEFNTATIIVNGNSIEHWLNGHRVVSATVGSDEWKKRVAASKFAKVKGFGENASGRIMLTDHGAEVWYRKFEIEELPDVSHVVVRPARRGLLSRLRSNGRRRLFGRRNCR